MRWLGYRQLWHRDRFYELDTSRLVKQNEGDTCVRN
jgi:hypothetical protein